MKFALMPNEGLPPAKDPGLAELPHDIEAEQQLLGAIINDNNAFDRVSGLVQAKHFIDPVHSEIFEVAATRIERNQLVSPITLKGIFKDHPGMRELGGAEYLVRLSGCAIASFWVADYAKIVRDTALRRELIGLGRNIAARAATESNPDDDPHAQIDHAEQSLYSLRENGKAEGDFVSFRAAMTDALNIALAAYKRGEGIAGLDTGFADLNKMLGGLHPSDLIILAGRPSMGKTALATNIAFNVAKAYRRGTRPDGTEGTTEGGVVGFFSLEMSAEQLATRILSGYSKVPSNKVRNGNLTEEEFRQFAEAVEALETCALYIDDTPALSINQLAARARRMRRTQGLDLVVVDYLQLAQSIRANSRSDNRVIEIGEITQGLKALAKELNIPVIALSQLSRQVELRPGNNRPQLSDLRDSGSIEQDADVVMFVYRESYYVKRQEPSADEHEEYEKWKDRMNSLDGKAEIIVGKQRHGPVGKVEMCFLEDLTQFGDLPKTWQSENGQEF